MSFAFTHEQLPAINSLARLVKLVAFAGTGKTTTLVGYAQGCPNKRILYLCYQKRRNHCQAKIPLHVTCRTSHGMAYGPVGSKYKHKLTGNHLMATKAQFDEAAQRLLGKTKYANLFKSGFTRPDFCREIAQDAFIHDLMDSATQSDDIALIQNVAHQLWKGDGVTGLDK